MNIGDYKARLTVQTAGEDALAALKQQIAGLQNSVDDMASGFSKAKHLFEAFAGSIVVEKFAGFVQSAIDLGDELNDLSQKFGVSVEALSTFMDAGATAGASLETIANSFKKLAVNEVEAATGNKSAAAAFKVLGVSVKDTGGRLKDSGDLALDVADKFSAMSDGSEKAALAVKLFGKSGADMIPTLNMGREGILAYGGAITGEFARAADAFNDRIAMMHVKVRNLSIVAAQALIPTMNDLVDAFSDLSAQSPDTINFFEGLGELGRLAGIALGEVYFSIMDVGSALATKAEQAWQIAHGNWDRVKQLQSERDRAQSERDKQESAFLEKMTANSFLFGKGTVQEIRARQQTTPPKRQQGNHPDVSGLDTSKDSTAENLAREARATEALIGSLYKLADAYGVSSAKAARMEIEAKATEQGIKKQADVAVYVDRQIRLAAAHNTVDAAKRTAALRDQTDAQEIVNNQVKKGLMTQQQAETYLKSEAELRPFIAAMALAEGDAKAKLAGVITRLTREQERANAAALAAKDIAQQRQIGDKTSTMTLVNTALAEFNRQRLAANDNLFGNSLADKMDEIELAQKKAEAIIAANAAAADFRKQGMPLAAQAVLEQLQVELQSMDVAGEYAKKLEEQKRNETFGHGAKRAMQGYADGIANVGEKAFATWDKALKGTEDALVNFAMTGKLSFKDLANSIIADLVRIAIQQTIMKSLTKLFGFADGGVFSGGSVVANAAGNAFSGGNVVPFATGGVVGRPMTFPMSGGRTGLMGEAGPEAIMPLRRMGNGRLGVEASGGAPNVVVNVDASGSQVQGNNERANALGQAIAVAVRSELIQQKRPGGLLAAA